LIDRLLADYLMVSVWCWFSGVVQLMTSLDREKQEMYQLRLIAFDKAARLDDRPVTTCTSASLFCTHTAWNIRHVKFQLD